MERKYSGIIVNGFVMVLINLALAGLAAWLFANADPDARPLDFLWGALTAFLAVFALKGYVLLEPNQAVVAMFFGRYSGTIKETGFFWMNPLMSRIRISLRLSNLDIQPIKVNDLVGNPILIGMVLVWRIEDTYKAVFDIQDHRGLQNFVAIQSDAALREVAGEHAYDDTEGQTDGTKPTLRAGGDIVNTELRTTLNQRLAMAGVEVTEARINYLAYSPEIAAVMLKRQQADAIISAREKIVEGAVSMVKLALDRIEADKIASLDSVQRAQITGNLLMVLCADEAPQPVIPTK
ncbi:MAG: SPFH domain-containing protein [Muribaculaceae bacterium]|nr:SPFH domain-containing protein [Muribaculaceae bacterium]